MRMNKLLMAGVTALSFVATPTLSFARDHDWRDGRGYRGERYHGGGYGYYQGGGHGCCRRDNDDALIAGVAGLAIGAILGSALSQPREPRYERDRRYQGPPPQRDDGYDRDDGYYEEGYQDGGYNGQCFRRELVWDPRLRRNVEVTHPIPC